MVSLSFSLSLSYQASEALDVVPAEAQYTKATQVVEVVKLLDGVGGERKLPVE